MARPGVRHLAWLTLAYLTRSTRAEHSAEYGGHCGIVHLHLASFGQLLLVVINKSGHHR
jgi:hypothetical protein